MIKRRLFLIVIALWLTGVTTVRADLTIWANNGEDKVTRDELRATANSAAVLNSAWNGSTVTLFGARNEVVNFNLVLEAGVHAVNGVTVQFNTLTGPAGATISSKAVTGNGVFDWTGRNIELFYVRYLTIKGLSIFGYNTYDERHVPERMRRPWSGEGAALPGTGWHDRLGHDKDYPEIAVPLELVNAFNIESQRNQSIWCDIYIPKTAAAGIYNGSITVAEGSAVYEVPVQLHVYDFSLPDMPTLKTMIYLGQSEINQRFLGQPWPNDPGLLAASLLITNRHYQLAHRHKLSLIGIEGAATDSPLAEWIPRLDGSLFSAANQYDGPGLDLGLNVFSIGTYGSWAGHWGQTEASMQQHADGWVTWFNNNFPGVECFLYLIDESTNYAQTERWANWIQNSAGPGKDLMTLATMNINLAPGNCPSVDIPATVTGVRNTPDVWEAAARYYRDTPGKRLYFYNGERPFANTFATEAEGVSLRCNAWIQYKIGIQRWFFWQCNFWTNTWGGDGETNVFQTAKTIGATTGFDPVRGETGGLYSNGDGVLLYPGTDLAFPQDSYNVQGPIGGLRMKHWRRGIQDGDYLELAKAVDPVRVQEIVSEMVPKALWEYGVNDPNDPTWVRTDISWSTNPDVWEAARAELADIIVNQGVNRFYVSGSVTINGTGIQGVVLNGLPGNPVTNTSGQYTMTVVSGWSGIVTPTKAGYTFTSDHIDYSNIRTDQTGQNYSASTIPYTISGTITYNGSGLANVVLYGLPSDPVTNDSGEYTANVHSGFSGTVLPILAGYTFTPAFHSYPANQTAAQTGQDYTASVSSSGSDPSGEGGGGGGGGGCFISGAVCGFNMKLPANLLGRICDWFSTTKVFTGEDSRARPLLGESFRIGQVCFLLDALVVGCFWVVAAACFFYRKRTNIQDGSNQRL